MGLENEYFFVWSNCGIVFGSLQNWTILGGHFYTLHFSFFFLSLVKVQNGNEFGGSQKFQILSWVCLIFLIFFGVNIRCWVQAYV